MRVTSPNFSNSFGGGSGMRPNATGLPTDVPGGPQIVNGGLYFNPAVQTPPFQFRKRSAALILRTGAGHIRLGRTAFRPFALREPLSLDFRAELFNAFNNVQFAGPNTDISSSSFGRIYLNQVNTPRQIQASLRLTF